MLAAAGWLEARASYKALWRDELRESALTTSSVSLPPVADQAHPPSYPDGLGMPLWPSMGSNGNPGRGDSRVQRLWAL